MEPVQALWFADIEGPRLPDPVKDLPDPLEEPPTTAGGNADDLVAQLADEAIDKLIADADRGEAPPPAEPVVAPKPEPAPIETAPVDTAPVDTATVGAPPADEAASAPLQDQLDTLFNQLKDDSVAPVEAAPEPAPAEPAPATPGTPIAMPPPVDVPADIAGLPTGASPDSAQDPNVTPTMQSDVRALLDDAVHNAPRADVPSFIVRPLEWINAPFANLSDDTRDTLGQIAVVTLINALAVILYVILFRRG